jgi:hypothetical protein
VPTTIGSREHEVVVLPRQPDLVPQVFDGASLLEEGGASACVEVDGAAGDGALLIVDQLVPAIGVEQDGRADHEGVGVEVDLGPAQSEEL